MLDQTGAGANRLAWFGGGEYDLSFEFPDVPGDFTQQVMISFNSRSSRQADWVFLYDSLQPYILMKNLYSGEK